MLMKIKICKYFVSSTQKIKIHGYAVSTTQIGLEFYKI